MVCWRVILFAFLLGFVAEGKAALPRKSTGEVDWSKIEFRKPTFPTEIEHRLAPLPSAKDQLFFNYKAGEEVYDDICGRTATSNQTAANPHIVGGSEAKPHSYPWACATYVNDKWFCSCTVISNRWILTAAHCADGAKRWELFLGVHDLDKISEPGRIELVATESVTHPRYNAALLENDIALVKLPVKIAFSNSIRPNCLPRHKQANYTFRAQTVKAIGWGRPSERQTTISPTLREVDVQVISNYVCNSIYGLVQDTTICTSGSNGKGICNGDSGSSLSYAQDDGVFMQLGVASFGHISGCEQNYPNGYARVSKYLDWIETKTNIKIRQ